MQLQTGNLNGTVADQQGQALPGVTVTVSDGGAPQAQATDAQGEFRFLGLMPGTCTVTAELEGFATARLPGVQVHMGRTTGLPITLLPAVIQSPGAVVDPPLPEP